MGKLQNMNYKEFESVRKQEPAVMLYFYNHSCGVCLELWPKVEALMQENFPLIKLIRVHADESREVAGQLRMLSVPGILLFMEGKEIFRANGMVSLYELNNKILRPYELMFS